MTSRDGPIPLRPPMAELERSLAEYDEALRELAELSLLGLALAWTMEKPSRGATPRRDRPGSDKRSLEHGRDEA